MENSSKTIIYEIVPRLEESFLYYFAEFDELPKKVDKQIFSQNKPLPDNFVWPRFTKGERRKLNAVDFPHVWSQRELLLVSETAWPKVSKIMEISGQCYSIAINQIAYRLCFPWHVYKLFYWDQSLESLIYTVEESGVLSDQYPIFQLHKFSVLYTISSPKLRKEGLDFKSLVQKNKLTGLKFRKFWESAE